LIEELAGNSFYRMELPNRRGATSGRRFFSILLLKSLLLKRGLGLGEPRTMPISRPCEWVAIQSRTDR
jgi:hypothetical protein